jgi:formate C-acetyltransferase
MNNLNGKEVDVSQIGSWQETFTRTCSDRVKTAIKRAVREPEICLEHARSELAVSKELEGQDIPRITYRALVYKHYLENRKIFIADGEVIVGHPTSKFRASPVFADLHMGFIDRELGDPERDFAIRPFDKHFISDDERKELREVLIPYFRGKTLDEFIYSTDQQDVLDEGFVFTSKCKHIANFADMMTTVDPGHTIVNYEKVLKIGLNGIREEAMMFKKRNEQSYVHFLKDKKSLFYDAVIMVLDAAIAHATRYSELAIDMAKKESDPKRKAELLEISRIAKKVPAEPAESWQEALQAMWFVQVSILCEQVNWGDSFGRFDQYMYPYYKKSVDDDKSITRDQALELLELFFVKASEFTELYDYVGDLVQIGFPISQNIIIGGQTQKGEDACNDLTMLILDAEEQVGLIQPEIAFRVWEGSPTKYLRRACEVVRLGRGKPKFYGDRVALEMIRHAYPYLTDEEIRDYIVIGCIELAVPNITNEFTCTGITNVAKMLDIVLHNGICSLCGEPIGLKTGDPRSFKTFEDLKDALSKQIDYSTEIIMKSIKVEMEAQAQWNHAPFASSLLDGPLEKGTDLVEGGAIDSSFGIQVAGASNTADSLTVIQKLIYEDKKITWDELLQAIDDNWVGHERLQQLVINGVPKYGNDDDYADSNMKWVLDTWYDSIDEGSNHKEWLPYYGGKYKGLIVLGNSGCSLGENVGPLPDGRTSTVPLADGFSPVQGRDVNGTTAVLKSISKLPNHRFEEGTLLNQRLTPALLATDEDIDKFVNYLRTMEELGIFHVQFNIVDSKVLKAALADPEQYRDLLVRVASYTAYYVELDPVTQQDIINRTQQNVW